jgi:hypothetical protein
MLVHRDMKKHGGLKTGLASEDWVLYLPEYEPEDMVKEVWVAEDTDQEGQCALEERLMDGWMDGWKIELMMSSSQCGVGCGRSVVGDLLWEICCGRSVVGDLLWEICCGRRSVKEEEWKEWEAEALNPVVGRGVHLGK